MNFKGSFPKSKLPNNNTAPIAVNKMVFAGMNLDVIVKDDVLWFIGSQVAKAVGFAANYPKDYIKTALNAKPPISIDFKHLQDFNLDNGGITPTDNLGRKLRKDAFLFNEATVYLMLMRGHTEKTEPFRKWVTEEVLPTIRKTGSYAPCCNHPYIPIQYPINTHY